MNKNEILSSAMAEENIEKLNARKAEISETIETRTAEFESSDVETRENILSEIEDVKNEAESIDKEIAELEDVKNTFKEQEERMSLSKNLSKPVIEERKNQMEEVNVLKSAEYTQMYADMIRGRIDEKEVRSYLNQRADAANLATTTQYVPIPEIMQGFVETAWYTYGKFSRLVSETFEPAILKIPVEVSADGANWHDENDDPVTQESITFGQIILQPKMIKKFIALTDELMAMAAQDFLRYISDELVYRVILALDEAIINRTDANGLGVIGIAGNTLTESVSAALDFNVINEAVSELVTFEDITIAMNPATFFKNFMGLTDQVGNPIYRVVHDNENRPQYYLSGYRVEFTQALPAYDDADPADVYAVVGNFRRGYRLNYPQGRNVITLVDPYTLATEDVVRMIGRLYVAGNVVKPKHFAAISVPASA